MAHSGCCYLLADQSGAEDDEPLSWRQHSAQANGVIECSKRVDVFVRGATRQLPCPATSCDHEVFVVERRARFELEPAAVNIEPGRAISEQQFNILLGMPLGRPERDLVKLFGAGQQRF